MMGISPAHLGSQVQCPHCQAVVQTPAASPNSAPSPPPPPPVPDFGAGEQESIFGPPEANDDDLFGSGPAPRLEMPRELMERPEPISPTAPTVTMEPAAHEQVQAAPSASFTEQIVPGPHEELTPFVPRRVDDKSMFIPILLIFLVPYAIFTTAFIGYLLYTWPKDSPLRNLQDPATKGGPRLQVKHDYPLDRDMTTALGQPIRVGAIEVTPVKIKQDGYGDLVLVFRAKNVSPDLVFTPISAEYMKYSEKSLDSGRPYTFLERTGKDLKRIYGGNVELLKGPADQERPFDGDIGPGEEAVVHLTTDVKYRNSEVPKFLKAAEKLVWRVQVRRGFVAVDGKQISATTVIGVEFAARDIVKDRTERNDDDT
jgi:hypothetical protein